MHIYRQTRVWLLLTAIFLIVVNTPHVFAGGDLCSGTSETDLENVMRARGITQGVFFRIDSKTLKFEGHIDRGTYDKYLEAIDDEVTTMIINSPGGDSYDGVRIGLDMAKRNIDVIVDGVAGSSAANYLFTAGKRKIICRGFVGFHGNAGALYDKKTFEASIRSSVTDRKQIDKVLKETVATAEATIKLEKELFAKLGISQKLFDITQLNAKGLSPEQNLDFEFLLPSIRTMARFGIHHVEGRQDIDLAERLGLAVIYY